jgi:hypothetical protein
MNVYDGHGRLWHRGWTLPTVSVLLAFALAACGGGSADPVKDQGARLGTPAVQETVASPTPTATADPVKAARATGRKLTRSGKYTAAIAAYEGAGLDRDANRVRRQGARALYRSAQSALTGGRYSSARRLALQSRRLRKTTAATTVLTSAAGAIAKAAAAARERRRQARIARDARTCTSAEKRTVRDGGGTRPGCATYAAERAQQAAEDAPAAGGDCDPNYSGACLKPDSPDYDCEGGSGNGPDYTGPVQVVGADPYDLDANGDGYGCES